MIEGHIREEIVCEDPLAGDNVGATGSKNKFPCPIAHEGLVLLHSRTLVRIGEGVMNRGRDVGLQCQGSRSRKLSLARVIIG
jgi:hypothetical protein